MLGRSLGMVPVSDCIITLLVLKRLLASRQNRSTIALILRARKVPPGCLPVPLLTRMVADLDTNKDSISLGLVCGLGDIAHAQKSVPQMLEDFKQHPAIRPMN
ncbi:hypothetical protein ACLB1M_14120 [Escherichia coli]